MVEGIQTGNETTGDDALVRGPSACQSLTRFQPSYRGMEDTNGHSGDMRAWPSVGRMILDRCSRQSQASRHPLGTLVLVLDRWIERTGSSPRAYIVC